MPHARALQGTEALGPLGVIAPPDIQIACEAFQGTLAALFQCVRKHQIDLLDIPLGPICAAYVEYLVTTDQLDLESAAVAMGALAYLIERKAWALLPVPEEDMPEHEEEWEALEPYAHVFAPAIDMLRERGSEREQTFFREPDGHSSEYKVPLELGEVTTEDLARALQRVLARAKPPEVEPLGKPRRSLAEQMVVVLRRLKSDAESLGDLLGESFTRTEVMWWFLALLELIRLGQARVTLREEDQEVMFHRTDSASEAALPGQEADAH